MTEAGEAAEEGQHATECCTKPLLRAKFSFQITLLKSKQILSAISKDKNRVCIPFFLYVDSSMFLLGVWKGEWQVLANSPSDSCYSNFFPGFSTSKRRQS